MSFYEDDEEFHDIFPNVWPGLYEGTVEFINDPAQLGRIKIRVEVIHGAEELTTEDLPWARPCVPYAAPGAGVINVPPEGSVVYVAFKHGDPQYPIYIGSFYANTEFDKEFLRNGDKTLPEGIVSMTSKEKETWTVPAGPDGPKEFLIQSNNRPERAIIFKTVKGASLDINERDEDERLALHDRSGQALVFDSNVSKKLNIKNESARDVKSAYEGDSLPVSSTLTNEGSINIVDIGGQSITLNTKQDNSKITIISKEADIEASSQKEIDGTSTVTLDLAGGDKRITLEIKDENEVKAKFILDGNTGFLEILSPLLVKINSQNILLNGNVTVDGNLTVTKNIYTLNDKIN